MRFLKFLLNWAHQDDLRERAEELRIRERWRNPFVQGGG